MNELLNLTLEQHNLLYQLMLDYNYDLSEFKDETINEIILYYMSSFNIENDNSFLRKPKQVDCTFKISHSFTNETYEYWGTFSGGKITSVE